MVTWPTRSLSEASSGQKTVCRRVRQSTSGKARLLRSDGVLTNPSLLMTRRVLLPLPAALSMRKAPAGVPVKRVEAVFFGRPVNASSSTAVVRTFCSEASQDGQDIVVE